MARLLRKAGSQNWAFPPVHHDLGNVLGIFIPYGPGASEGNCKMKLLIIPLVMCYLLFGVITGASLANYIELTPEKLMTMTLQDLTEIKIVRAVL